jgi:two-component system, NarL family, response regulator DevR
MQVTLNLTNREIEVVKAIADDLANKEIGTKLGMSERMVKHYVTQIYMKLGFTIPGDRSLHRVKLTRWAIRNNLVSP